MFLHLLNYLHLNMQIFSFLPFKLFLSSCWERMSKKRNLGLSAFKSKLPQPDNLQRGLLVPQLFCVSKTPTHGADLPQDYSLQYYTTYTILYFLLILEKNHLKGKIGIPCMFVILSTMFYTYELMTMMSIIPLHQMLKTPYEESLA